MSRRLGQILVDDFQWDHSQINAALSAQARAVGRRPRLGDVLRSEPTTTPPGSRDDIPLALILQRLERDTPRTRPDPRAFDPIEYTQLGDMLRDERRFMDNKLRSYVAVLAGLVLYIAYPLNLVLSTPAARPSDWPGLLLLYAVLGASLVVVAFATGDNVVKSYALFIKRRTRLAMARRQLRAANCAMGTLTPTVMPSREVISRGFDAGAVPERADPELSGFQRSIPIYYSLWSLLKLGLLLFFVACLVGGTFPITREILRVAVAMVLVLALAWCHFMALLCERYHKTLREALLLSGDNPFPRVSTFALRTRGEHRAGRAFALWAHTVGALTVLGVGAYQLFVLQQTDDRLLWLMAAVLAVHFLGRVVDVLNRLSRARVGPTVTQGG